MDHSGAHQKIRLPLNTMQPAICALTFVSNKAQFPQFDNLYMLYMLVVLGILISVPPEYADVSYIAS